MTAEPAADEPACGTLTRRAVVLGAAALPLAACQLPEQPVAPMRPVIDARYAAMYGPIFTEPYPIPAVDITKFEPQFLRREVRNPTGQAPGTIVVDTTAKFLYFTLPNGLAMRYGVGLGRAGFGWDGTATIPLKRKWPTWTPPPEMIVREPDLEQWREGMPPGLANPLGARALYLFQGGADTLYRLHGTQEAFSIGRNVSSGCVRLLNHDIIDLYNRTPLGAKVIVRPAAIY
ncbi:L,D-transpeptidase [Acuticoccus sp.]|uniref:L,D-transpeptidase n=1 Tax=Acuticoccus sp. TaxID=1904378 RepID=UPI003B52D8F3